MSIEWDRHESGPADAERTVLLLPGGLSAARSYAELMAQPMLSQVHLIAVTLPGHAGTRPLEDFSIEGYARQASKLAADLGCDVVLGFSVGASIALEMVASGQFSGPVVLLGVSLSPRGESRFLRVLSHRRHTAGRQLLHSQRRTRIGRRISRRSPRPRGLTQPALHRPG